MLTGRRQNEIGSLRWSEIDFKARAVSLDGTRTNGRAHLIPFSDAALAVLKGVTQVDDRELYSGRGGALFRLVKGQGRARCGLRGQGLDAARSAAHRGNPHGGKRVLPHVIEATLNHVSGHKSGVAGRSNRWTYETEKREALDTLASYIKTAMANPKARPFAG